MSSSFNSNLALFLERKTIKDASFITEGIERVYCGPLLPSAAPRGCYLACHIRRLLGAVR